MENDVYEPIVAVTTDVAIFYAPVESSGPDEFVLPDAPEVEPVVLVPLVDMAVAAEEPVAESVPVFEPQWVYTGNGWGAYFGADGNNIDPGIYYAADPSTHEPILFA